MSPRLRQRKVTETFPETLKKTETNPGGGGGGAKRKLFTGDENEVVAVVGGIKETLIVCGSGSRSGGELVIKEDFLEPLTSSSTRFLNSSINPENENPFLLAKRALHLSTPQNLPGREPQIKIVHEFVSGHLMKKTGGALYISGAPGTGKTAVVKHVLNKLTEGTSLDDGSVKPAQFSPIFINCMCLKTTASVFEEIGKKLRFATNPSLRDRIGKRVLSKTAKPLVLILDEMDQLLSGGSNDVLTTLFEWANLPGSRLVLIGVANALDLGTRQIPMLGSKGARKTGGGGAGLKSGKMNVETLSFPPYERQQVSVILQDRLLSAGTEIFDPAAIKFVAGKVAASTGDLRKALHACKMAIEDIEKKERGVLKVTTPDGFNGSPKKQQCIRPGTKVGVSAVCKILGPSKDDGALPLQQKLILVTLLRIRRLSPESKRLPNDGVDTPVLIETLYSEYRKLCEVRGFTWIDRSEMLSVCSLLEDRNLLRVIGGSFGGTPNSNGKKGPRAKPKSSGGPGILFEPKAAEKILTQHDAELMKTLLEL